MLRKHISLKSSYTVNECLDLLRPHIDSTFLKLGGKDFAGKVAKDKASFRKKLSYNNGFQTVLSAKLSSQENATGTLIEARVGMGTTTILSGLVWLSVVTLATLFCSLPLAFQYLFSQTPEPGGNSILLIIIPPSLLLFGALLVSFGRWLARDEEAVLMTFLQTCLKAEIVTK